VDIVVTEILNIAHLCRIKTHISEAGSASFFRWNVERGKPTVVDLLERASRNPWTSLW